MSDEATIPAEEVAVPAIPEETTTEAPAEEVPTETETAPAE